VLYLVYSKFSVSCQCTTRTNLKKSLKQVYPSKKSTLKKKKEGPCSLLWMKILLLTSRLNYYYLRKLSLKSKIKNRSLSSRRSIHSVHLKNCTTTFCFCWRRQNRKRLTSINTNNASITFKMTLKGLEMSQMRQIRNLTPSLSNKTQFLSNFTWEKRKLVN
jgi:hypothetical protein